ncbi:hypothetical protein LUZ60_008504 [Juncus effusus]|nr:hypothetical protein LUZ60_008504 [Juncus effusus]
MALVLHAEEGNKNACKSLIAAEYCGVKVDHVKEYQMGVSDKAHLFLKNSVFAIRNCAGKVPVLETPEGPIVESNAMIRYVAKLNGDNNNLCGSSAFEFVQIEQWMSYATTDIDEILVRWVYLRTGVYPYGPRTERRLIECMKRSLYLLNFHLAKKERHYLVGHRITLADIVMTCDLYLGFSCVLLKSLTSEFPHVERYFWNLVGQPNFKKFLGEVEQAKEMPPEIRPWGGLYVSPEVFEALIKKRTNQMMDLEEEEEEEEEVNNEMMKAGKARG